MHLDPILPTLAVVSLCVVIVGFLLRRVGIPSMIGYLISGVVLGPHVLGVIEDQELLGHLGGLGVVLLLFFVGMEISPERLIAVWRVAVGGTLLQVALSVGCVFAVAGFLDWPMKRAVLLGFVISLSSTAVALRMASAPGVPSRVTDQVTGILLVQDVIFVPMILVLGFLQGEQVKASALIVQGVVGAACLLLFLWVVRKREIHLGLHRFFKKDRELQVFAGLIVCFGLSLITGLAGLSSALGAFLAGILISSARETDWIHESLEPFRVVFVALFFLSIGMLLDLEFFFDRIGLVLMLALLALATNTLLNAGIFRLFGSNWRESFYGAAFLAQIGELSFILAAIGKNTQIVEDFSYQVTVAVITVTLILSPLWAWVARTCVYRNSGSS